MRNLITIFIIFVLAIVGVMSDVEGCTIPSCQFFNNGALKNSEMQKEIWKDLIGYEGYYMVSNYGRIRSLERTVKNRTNKVADKILKLSDRNGYKYIQLCKNNEKPFHPVHRIVANNFIPNTHNKPHVNHIDGNPSNNNVSNLEWCTPSENELHSYRVLGKVPYSKGKIGKYAMRKKPVNQYSLDGVFIRKFDNMADIRRMLGIDDTGICKVAKGKQKTAGGYKWEYA